MADVRVHRQKVNVVIKLWSPDIADIMKQQEVAEAMLTEELEDIIASLTHELNRRKGEPSVIAETK